MPEIAQSTKELIQKYQTRHQSLQQKEGLATIHVDEVASRVASFYEKMRGVIDYREEHLLRKTAIERTLNRRLLLKKNGEAIAQPLVQELIRGGHFPNDAIPEEKIAKIQKSIDKYVFIVENAPGSSGEKIKSRLHDWILGIAACEIEEILSPPVKEAALMEFMLEQMKEKIEVRGGSLISQKMPEEERETQIYIAIQQALFRLDPPIIGYNLLKKWYPEWLNLSPDQLRELTKNIYSVWQKIEENLNHSLAEKFYSICERQDTAFLILGDILSENPQKAQENLKNPAILENKIRESYNLRLQKVKATIGRAAVYSTVSIFLTKMLVAFAVEVPFDKYIGQYNELTLAVNVLIPPLLMFFLVLSIKPPSKQNEELVIMEVMKIVYEREKKEVYEIKPAPKRGIVMSFVIGFIYFLSFVVSFGLIIWILQKLGFSILSMAIFLIFISLISFAGVRIRQRAKELMVEKEKETFLRTILDLFSLPIIQMGKWLSHQWTKYNVITVLFHSLIDMPFQVFVEFLEQWRLFLKEKKEKIY